MYYTELVEVPGVAWVGAGHSLPACLIFSNRSFAIFLNLSFMKL